MALIKCPECGQDVSDKAAQCPRCGYPIAEMMSEKTAKLKMMPVLQAGGIMKIHIINTETGEDLGNGINESVIEVKIDKPTTVRLSWGQIVPQWKNATFTIEPNKKYVFVWIPGFFNPKLDCHVVDSFVG